MPGFDQVEHVVVLMLENRSFDHMAGAIPGVNGIVASNSHGHYQLAPAKDGVSGEWKLVGGELKLKDLYNLEDPKDPSSRKIPLQTGAPYILYGDGPSHSYPSATQQIYGDNDNVKGIPSKDYTPETLCGFVSSYSSDAEAAVEARNKATAAPKMSEAEFKAAIAAEMAVPMQCFTPERAPVLSTLAAEFCVCDNWFSEVPGPTEPNRLFVHGATSQGFTHNVSYSTVKGYQFDDLTVCGNMQKAGHSWGFYHYNLSDDAQYKELAAEPQYSKTYADNFAKDVAAGNLPNYTFICPDYATPANSQHAPHDIRYGEYFMADTYEALRANEDLWPKTLLIILYDEHGGFFDHVYPNKPVPAPDGNVSPTALDKELAAKHKEDAWLVGASTVFDFTRAGLRVPALLISPWIKRGTVLSEHLQHTSISATMKKRFGLPGFLTKRDAAANTFEGVLNEMSAPRDDTPTKLVRPPQPETHAQNSGKAADVQPLTKAQKEMFTASSGLDGGDWKNEPLPKTQKELRERAADRRQRHAAAHK